MEEYTVFSFSNRALNVVASRKALEKIAGSVWCELILYCVGSKDPPVLLTATHLIRAKVLR